MSDKASSENPFLLTSLRYREHDRLTIVDIEFSSDDFQRDPDAEPWSDSSIEEEYEESHASDADDFLEYQAVQAPVIALPQAPADSPTVTYASPSQPADNSYPSQPSSPESAPSKIDPATLTCWTCELSLV